jgi:hypothetical protein
MWCGYYYLLESSSGNAHEIDIQEVYQPWSLQPWLGVCFGWEPGATLGGLRAAVGAAGGTPRAEFLQLIYERNARSF